MPLAPNHTFNTIDLTAYTPSCAASPVAAYMRAPFAGTIRKITGIIGGAITVASCTVTVTNVTQGTTVGTFVVPVAGSAAGVLASGIPVTSAVSQINEDDVLAFTPAGATGTAIPMHFSAALRTGY